MVVDGNKGLDLGNERKLAGLYRQTQIERFPDLSQRVGLTIRHPAGAIIWARRW